MSEPRTIVVMRHSKAEKSGPTDFERQLTDRGLGDAAEAGAWLARRDVVPDHALVSAAVRAEQTWESLVVGAGWDIDAPEAQLDEALYDAGPESALDVMRAVPDYARTLIVIGHNPTMASLAQLLDDGAGDEDAGIEMATGYPTSALAVFTYDGDWADLDEASVTLVGFHVGRG